MQTVEEIVNGIARYADREVIPKLNTQGKWIVGALVGVIGNKSADIMRELQSNPMFKAIGIIDDNGLYDVDLIAENVIQSAEKYGKLQLNVPAVGLLTFDHEDVNNLKKYIKGEM